MATRQRTDEVLESGAVFLAPEKVGSSIRWTATAYRKNGRQFNASVHLADCDQKIEWAGYGERGPEHMKKKLLVAIAELHLAYEGIVKAEKHFASLAPKARSKKA